MQSNVGKWGNSLAIRLPAGAVRATGLTDGASVELEVTPAGEIRIIPARSFDKTAFLKQLAALHRLMPESDAVLDELRQTARY